MQGQPGARADFSWWYLCPNGEAEAHRSSLLLAGERAYLDLDTYLPVSRRQTVFLQKNTFFPNQIFSFLSVYSTVENVSLRQNVKCYSPCVNMKRVIQPDPTEHRRDLSKGNADGDGILQMIWGGNLKARPIASLASRRVPRGLMGQW